MPEKRPANRKPYSQPEVMRFDAREVFPPEEVLAGKKVQHGLPQPSKVRLAADRHFVESCVKSGETQKALAKIQRLMDDGLKISEGLQISYKVYSAQDPVVRGTNLMIRAGQMCQMLCSTMVREGVRGRPLGNAATQLMKLANILDSRFPRWAEVLRAQAQVAKEKAMQI